MVLEEVEDGALRLFGRVLRLVTDVDRSTPTAPGPPKLGEPLPKSLMEVAGTTQLHDIL
jgi:hypothetical protein